MSRGLSRRVSHRIESLEKRQLLSTSLDIGSIRYTADGDSLYRSDLDGGNPVLLHQWPTAGAAQPSELFNYNGTLLFSAALDGSSTGAEPWKSDGTPQGTKFIADIIGGHEPSSPHDWHLIKGRAVFLGVSYGFETVMYSTDGNTVQQLFDVNTTNSSYDYNHENLRDVTWGPNSVKATVFNYAAKWDDRLSSDGTAAGTRYLYSVPQDTDLTVSGKVIHVGKPDAGHVRIDSDYYSHYGLIAADDVTSLNLITYQADASITVDGAISLPATITGSDGNDTLSGGNGHTVFLGGRGKDLITARGGGNSVDGQDGADTIYASQSRDTIAADSADTIINTDTVSGGGGSVGAGSGGTTAYATLRNNVLRVYGTRNDDTISLFASGGTLAVVLNGVSSTEPLADVHTLILFAGDGDDTIQFAATGTFVSKVYGEAGADTITAGGGKDRLYGGAGDDWIDGGGNSDTIYGEAGDDRLFGSDGRDYLHGGAGANTLRGGTSRDRIFANAGDDDRANAGDLIALLS